MKHINRYMPNMYMKAVGICTILAFTFSLVDMYIW